jgi:hypothetical protein
VAFKRTKDAAARHIDHESSRREAPRAISRCLLCGSPSIQVCVQDRFVTTTCSGCRGILAIEFDPPDAPGIRARIERLDDPSALPPD